jgi:hypothetical protein
MLLTMALVSWSVSVEVNPGVSIKPYRIHSNAAVFEVSGPGARERAHSGFGCAVHTPRWEAFAGYDGRVDEFDRPHWILHLRVAQPCGLRRALQCHWSSALKSTSHTAAYANSSKNRRAHNVCTN